MRRTAMVGLALFANLIAGPSFADDQPQITADVHAQIEAGRSVFESTCSAGACHGSGGVGGRAPSLDRALPPDLIRKTVMNGRPGTPMPAFKDILTPEVQAQAIAFVTWLSSGGHAPLSLVVVQRETSNGVSNASVRAKQPTTSPWLGLGVSSVPVAIGSDKGNPAAGVTVFFDSTKMSSCRTCHNYAGSGGPLGPDLATISATPQEIYQSILDTKLPNPAYAIIALTMNDGSRKVGIQRDEDASGVRYYDVSSLPPVSYRVPKSDIKDMAPVAGPRIFNHLSLHYSKQELLDVSAYLGKTETPAP